LGVWNTPRKVRGDGHSALSWHALDTIGDFDVPVKPHREVNANVKLTVKKEE